MPQRENIMEYSDNSSDEEDGYNIETPLIAHVSRKTAPGHQFRKKTNLWTSYSSMSSNSPEAVEKGSFKQNHVDDDDNKSISSLTTTTSITTLTTHYVENFRESLLIPFTDEEGSPQKITAGLSSLAIVGTIVGLCMPKNENLPGEWYRIVSSVIGYIYFVSWSVCFYPQVLLNYRRKSTRGLSHDFAVLNLLGWTFYSAYVSSMFFDKEIKDMYAQRFSSESSTIQSNDVAFAVHAMILSFVYLVQIVYYGDGWWSLRLKPQTWLLLFIMVTPSMAVPLLIKIGMLNYSRWLDYFYVLSYFKICCTLTKYSKQVLHNWKRKSTYGWNIWYNFLECTGGALSMLQILLDSLDMNNLSGLTGNIAKFALGFATIFFDALFFTQHYVLYPQHDGKHNIPKHIGTKDPLSVSDSLDLTDSLRSMDDSFDNESLRLASSFDSED